MGNAAVIDRLVSRPSRTTTVRLAFNPEDFDRWRDAQQRVVRAEIFDETSDSAYREQAVADAEAALEAVAAEILTVTFKFVAIGPNAVEELIGKNPATKQQQQKFSDASYAENGRRGRLQWNEETFPPALLAASCIGINFSDGDKADELSNAEATQLWASKWPSEDRIALFNACLGLNEQGTAMESLGKD